eukprot:CFRG4568T1
MKYSVLGVSLFYPAACLAQTAQTFSIGLKSLILASGLDQLEKLPEHVLQSYGVDYDLLMLTTENEFTFPPCDTFDDVDLCGTKGINITRVDIDSLGLIDPTTNSPKYNSIILTSTALGYSIYNSDYELDWVQSALSQAMSTELDDYCVSYGVRTVVLNSNPVEVGDSAIQLDLPVDLYGIASDSYTFLSFVENDLTDSMHNVLKTDALIYLGGERVSSGSYYYWMMPVAINDTANHIQPLLHINYNCPDSNSKCQSVGAEVITDLSSGRETLHFHFTADIGGLHGFTLGHMWYPWITRGLFLSQRQIILDTHIDDYFLDTSVYNTTLNRQATDDEFDPPYTYRATSTDLDYHKMLQDSLKEVLPAGSNFTIEMAFNAIGYAQFADYEEYSPNVNSKTIELLDEFLWVTHTWNHIDMYCILSNCTAGEPVSDPLFENCYDWTDTTCNYEESDEPLYPASGYTPYEYNIYELTRNQYFADAVMHLSESLASVWSPKSIVTPRISGLNYTESLRAMLEVGIRTAVGDNSRTDLAPANPWHAFEARVLMGKNGVLLTDETKAEFETEMQNLYGVNSIMVIPRYATRIYFDTSLPEELEMEHNSFYGPTCYGYNQNEQPTSGGWKCNAASFKYDRNLTAAEVMAIEGFESARNLLSLRSDPYMFHQVNLRTFEQDSITQSLLSQWIEAALKWVTAYTTFPILSFKMDDLAEVYRQRQERDECELSGAVEYKLGMPVKLTISSQKSCEAKLTYTATQGSELFQPLLTQSSRRDASAGDNVDNLLSFTMSDSTQQEISLAGSSLLPASPTPTPTPTPSPTTTPTTTPTPTVSALPTNTPDPKTPSPVESDSSSLSTGATIGIAIAAVVVVIVAAIFVIWMMRRRRMKHSRI